MTQRIKVTAPFLRPPGDLSEGLLMYVYVADDNRIVTGAVNALKADPKIENILAVEIFGSLIEEETLSSFVVAALSAESKLDAGRFSPGGNRKPWKFVREDGTVIEFDEVEELKLKVRSPLSWAKGRASDDPPYNFTLSDDDDREMKVEFTFEFRDATVNNKKQANKDKCVRFRLGGSLTQIGGAGIDINVPAGFPLPNIFGQNTLTTSHDDEDDLWAPGVLRFDHFCPGEAPRGKHFWALRYAPAGGERDPRLPNLPAAFTRRGLRFDYNCVRSLDTPATRKGWGKEEQTASKLWPLGIAPLGNFATQAELQAGPLADRSPDISMTQLWPDPKLADVAKWELKVNWKQDAQVNGRTFTPFGAWNTLVAARHREALRTVKGGAPASIIPQLEEPAEQSWEVVYEVSDENPHQTFLKDVAHDGFSLRPEDFVFKFPRLRLKAATQEIVAAASLANFLNVKGEPVRRNLKVSLEVLGEDPDRQEFERGPRLLLKCVDVTDGAPAAQDAEALTSRAGALDLRFAATHAPDQTNDKGGQIEATLQGHLGESRFDAGAGRPVARPWLLAVGARVFFRLDGFRPGDQDLTPLEDTREEERRPSSIIFPFKAAGGGAQSDEFVRGEFLLAVEEKNDADNTHRLSMRLESLKQADGGRDVDLVIIDTSPFLVARVRTNVDLFSVGEVGNWTGDDPGGASWELKDPGGSFEFILPPQGVGEEFVKSYDSPPEAGRTLDYRLSPPAVFKLSRTPFKQSFSEAPWNLRRLLGFPGQRQPGMGVNSLGFELMYGLSANVTADPDDLKLTELSAVVGRLPRPLDKDDVPFRLDLPPDSPQEFLGPSFGQYAEGDAEKLSRAKSRLALLQLRRAVQKTPFLTLTDGVSFHFRCSRRVAHPFKRAESSVADCPPPNKLRGGLQGGVDWGFTSENVYNEVIGSRVSVSGKIVNPSFTALGGSGYQEAVFANGKSTLYTDTFLGRTFFYSIERIGRIGMLWNTAKHVLIYERTVVDTDQFKDTTEGRRWLGRPVMRKVREYVEILQPERDYPEFGESPKVRGFVRASKFPQTVIFVDSAWGRDVPGGWVVPLFNPAADPTFYQPPDVRLKLTASEKTAALAEAQGAGDGERPKSVEQPFVWCQINSTDNLLFYTSTDPNTTKKTDDWPPAAGVDFPLSDIPANPADPAAAPTDLLGVMKGYERFTLKVDTGKVPVNLLAERLTAISDAVVENVSIIRRNLEAVGRNVAGNVFHQTQQAVEEILHDGRQFESRLRQAGGEVVSAVAAQQTAVAAIKEQLDNLPRSVEQILQGTPQAPGLLQRYQRLAEKGLSTVLQSVEESLKTTWARAFERAAADIERQLREVVEGQFQDIEEKRRRVDEVFQEAELLLRHVERKIQAGGQEITVRERQLVTAIHEVEDLARRAFERLRELARKNTVEAVTNRAKDIAQSAVLPAAQKLETYRAAVVSGLAEIERELSEVRGRLRSLDANLWRELETRLREFVDEMLPAAPTFPFDPAKLAEIRNKLESYQRELGNLTAKFNPDDAANFAFKETAAKIKSFDRVMSDNLEGLEALKAQIVAKTKLDAAFLQSFRNTFVAVRNDVAEKFFDKVTSELANDASPILAEAKRALGDIQSAEAALRQQLERARDVGKEVLERLGDQLSGEARRAYQEFASSIAGPVAEALAPFERWAKEVDFQNLRNMPQQVADEARKLGDSALRLVRAHGLAPVGEAIKLSEERVAYYFHEAQQAAGQAASAFRQLENAVDITPSDVLVNGASGLRRKVAAAGQALDSLKSLGIALPTKRIAERFLPDLPFMHLDPPRLKDILPDFAGINLSSIFSDAAFPLGQSDAVKITHGIDPATFRPWAQCDVAMPLAGDTVVFNVGPLMVNIVGAFFRANTRVALDAGGGTRREVRASIRADWMLTVAGQRVLTIKNSTLQFDDSGKIKFDMGAKDIELAEVLRFITDLLKTTGGGDKSGLTFELLRAGALPVGARAALNLALPALQTGAFSVSNISLNAFFELMLLDGQFQLAVGLGLSSRERPFNLSILCLGGGGWFVVRALYRPFGGPGQKLTAMLSIGISAGASLPFDIGVASGGVYFFVGVGVEYRLGGGQGSLTILLRVSLMGEVSVLGIISIQILLALEARYGNGSLVCTGELRVKIKICWCFTLSVSTSFTMTLAGGGGSPADDPRALTREEQIEKAVADYLESFGD
jgi:hypothetical protein